jgi:hypothetical protein
MAFADPQSITISGTPVSLPRTNVQNNKSEYTSSDGLVRLTASHAYGRRTRRVLRVDHSKIAADLFIPAQNAKLSMSNYIVFDVPVLGYTPTEAKAVYDGFKATFTASTDALITKLLAGES